MFVIGWQKKNRSMFHPFLFHPFHFQVKEKHNKNKVFCLLAFPLAERIPENFRWKKFLAEIFVKQIFRCRKEKKNETYQKMSLIVPLSVLIESTIVEVFSCSFSIWLDLGLFSLFSMEKQIPFFYGQRKTCFELPSVVPIDQHVFRLIDQWNLPISTFPSNQTEFFSFSRNKTNRRWILTRFFTSKPYQ